jgi:hypothetical protein
MVKSQMSVAWSSHQGPPREAIGFRAGKVLPFAHDQSAKTSKAEEMMVEHVVHVMSWRICLRVAYSVLNL